MNHFKDDPGIQLRDATIEDLELLEYWESQAHVLAAGIEDWPWEEELKSPEVWRRQLIAESRNRPIGFVQIMNPALDTSAYWGSTGADHRTVDIWIGEASDLGQGYGTLMMTVALDWCFAEPGVKAILIDPIESNKNAHRFYERLGFQFIENRYFDEDYCSVYRLSRKDWVK